MRLEAAARNALFLAAAVLAPAFVACQAGHDEQPPTEDDVRPATEGDVAVSPSMIDEIKRQSTPFQLALVEDGRLTFSEYEKAFFADVQCVTEAGISVPKTPVPSADQQFILETYYPDQSALERGLPEEARCRANYLEWIERVWRTDMDRYSPLYVEARRALGMCAQAAGLKLPESPTSEDVKPFFESYDPTYFRCLLEVQKTQNLNGWMP